ncbi:uncharacterized protein TNCV_1446081 [Trichonephila clavipes]|nr:uncharacterized protein TNCV_1446081 [Trichonephila clavipes]
MKRNCKTSEALLKNGKEGNPDMCIIVPDEDEKPPEIAYQNPPESDIANFFKIQRYKWAGRVVRMYEDRTTKEVFNAQPIGKRRKDKPILRWIDDLEKDLLVLRTKNWRILQVEKAS